MVRRYLDVVVTVVLIPAITTLIVMWADVRELKEHKADKEQLLTLSTDIKLNTQVNKQLTESIKELKEVLRTERIVQYIPVSEEEIKDG